MPYEQPLGDGSPAEGLPSLAPSKEVPSLPTRAPSYEAKRGAPKSQDRVPRRGTLLRSGQYDNCAKRHSVSSTEAKPWALYLTRMRVNTQEEKRKHGITCHTSRPLEKGRAEGAGWMCLEEAPFYATVSMATVQSVTPYRHRKRSRRIFASLVCE